MSIPLDLGSVHRVQLSHLNQTLDPGLGTTEVGKR